MTLYDPGPMAQTKKRRRTKHRGNAAGIVESRGRTGRKLTEGERAGAGQTARRGRQDRFSKPPTWRSAANRSLIAVVIFVAVLVLFLKQNIAAALSLGAFLLVLYVPMSYFTDLWLYRRHQRKLLAAKGARDERRAKG